MARSSECQCVSVFSHLLTKAYLPAPFLMGMSLRDQLLGKYEHSNAPSLTMETPHSILPISQDHL